MAKLGFFAGVNIDALGKTARHWTGSIILRAVAMLVPVASSQEKNPRQLLEEIRRLRKGKSLAGLSVGQLVKSGRRF